METWVTLLANGSGAAVMAVVIVVGAIALWRKWIVIGWQYTDLKDERDNLRADIKLTNTTTADLTKTLAAQTEAFTRLTDELRRGGEGGRR